MSLTVFSSWHVSVAAEALAAGLFARCGLDVSVQYGANQPEYDLVVAKGDHLMKVSVKGSQDGGWGLAQTELSKIQGAQYHAAIDAWLARHTAKCVLCFVQFKSVPEDQMPRVYLATPVEVACRLRATAKGRGDTVLWERREWGQRAIAAGSIDEIPMTWKFSSERVHALLLQSQRV
jgi:Holliday junction resolvase-like predicted endonuclease